MEISTGEVIASSPSMPHSPWRQDGRLWVLQSGRGRVGWIDPATSKYEALAELQRAPRRRRRGEAYYLPGKAIR